MAFHEPKLLSDEQHRLRDDVGLNPNADVTRETARGIIAAMAAIDAAGLGGADDVAEHGAGEVA